MCCRPSRILGAGRQARAPGGSPKPKSRQPGLIDALQDFTDPRRRQLDQSTRQIPGAQEPEARAPGCAAAFRILDIGKVAAKPQEAAQTLESRPVEKHPTT